MAEINFLKYKHSEVIIKIEASGAEVVDLDLDVDLIDTNRENLVGSEQHVNIKSAFWNQVGGAGNSITISRHLTGGTPVDEAIYEFTGTGTMKLDSFNTVGAADTVGKERDIRIDFGGVGGTVILRLGKMKGYAAKFDPAVDGYNAIEPS